MRSEFDRSVTVMHEMKGNFGHQTLFNNFIIELGTGVRNQKGNNRANFSIRSYFINKT